jgi:hypothetical protein
VTVLEQEKPVETQTLPSDVMWQFLQWTQTVVPCCLLAYRPWNFPTFCELAILAQTGQVFAHTSQSANFWIEPFQSMEYCINKSGGYVLPRSQSLNIHHP